jgi:hypothetical protein
MRFFDRRNKTPGADVAIGNAALEADLEDKQIPTTDGADDSSFDDSLPDKDVQDGVKKAQAITLSWTRKELIVAYAW